MNLSSTSFTIIHRSLTLCFTLPSEHVWPVNRLLKAAPFILRFNVILYTTPLKFQHAKVQKNKKNINIQACSLHFFLNLSC